MALFLGMAIVWAGATQEYEKGKTAYKAKRYSSATQYMESAVKENPEHTYAYFYLGLAQAKLHNYEAAKQAFQRVIEVLNMRKLQHGENANPVLLKKAQKNLAVVTKKQISQSSGAGKAHSIVNGHAGRSDNYLTYALHRNGQVVHWDLSRMPLKVYVHNGHQIKGWTPSLNRVVDQAMLAWQQATNNKIRFQKTRSLSDADIVVTWQRQFNHNTLGQSPLRTMGSTIVQSDVQLAVYKVYTGVNGTPLSQKELLGTALHEFGHALGIRGHSPYTEDLMFFSSNPTQNTALTFRDRNTINLLYHQKADVTNNARTSTVKTREAYELMQKAQEALMQNPSKALEYLRQARAIDSSHPDLQKMENIAYFKLGVQHFNNGRDAFKDHEDEKALKYFKRAEDLFERLSRQADPPEGTLENLDSIRNNIQYIKQYRLH